MALLCLAALAATAQASLLAIDLGSEFLKVCLVKPGRTPISIVVNEMSKRKSPALVGLVDGDRVVGEEAFSFAIRYPNTIYSQLRNLLGRSAKDAEVVRVLRDSMLLYKVVDHPLTGTAAIAVNETTAYLVEELVVSVQHRTAAASAASLRPRQLVVGSGRVVLMADHAGSHRGACCYHAHLSKDCCRQQPHDSLEAAALAWRPPGADMHCLSVPARCCPFPA